VAIIDVSVDINTPIDKVWDIVSDLDNEPKFWKGTKETKIISRDGNIVTREIIIAFRDSRCMQTITIQPKEKIHAKFTKGIIKGSKTINLMPKKDGAHLMLNGISKCQGWQVCSRVWLANIYVEVQSRHLNLLNKKLRVINLWTL